MSVVISQEYAPRAYIFTNSGPRDQALIVLQSTA